MLDKSTATPQVQIWATAWSARRQGAGIEKQYRENGAEGSQHKDQNRIARYWCGKQRIVGPIRQVRGFARWNLIDDKTKSGKQDKAHFYFISAIFTDINLYRGEIHEQAKGEQQSDKLL